MMTIKRQLRRAFRALPLLAVLAVLLAALYLVSSIDQASSELGRLTLWVFLMTGLALLVLGGAIATRIIRLVGRLRKREPGARLTARLVGVFIALALPPVVILYLFSTQFLSNTIEGWLNIETEQALADSMALSQLFLELRQHELSAQLQRLAGRLDAADEEAVYRRLLAQVSASGPTELSLLDASRQTRVSVSIDPTRLVADLPGNFALNQALENEQYAATERDSEQLRIRVLVRLSDGSLGAPALVLQGIYPLPAAFSRLADGIEQAYFRYRTASYLQGRLRDSLVLILTLVLMLTALLAMLVAFDAARRLSQPVRDLAAATREVAAGRFPRQLAVDSRDELGFLVRSFNTMTRELASNRQALEAQRRYLEIVLGRLSAGVLAVAGDRTLSACNESAMRILDLDNALGRSVDELLDQRPHLAPLFGRLLEQFDGPGGDWRQEIQLGTAEKPLVLVCRGSDLPTEPGGQVVVFDDVTVLDQAQREAAWAEVARRLAHEVKNPLTPIQLAAERLQYKLSPSLSESNRELLVRATTTIATQVDTLKRLVDAFGDYARPRPAPGEPVDWTELLTELVDLYATGQVPIEFDIRADDALRPVLADPGGLRQVLLNLVRNAQEAQPEGRPRIGIEVVNARHDGQPGVRLEINDDGPGFSAAVLERVFEPYVTTKQRGTGLGLAIVRRIIEQHGGFITVGNRPTGGACIRLWLPWAQAPV